MHRRLYAWLLAACACACAAAAAFAQGAPPAELGRSLYATGIGRDGRNVAGLGVHGCAGCHGDDGRGKSEGFVHAPDIRWSQLSARFPARRADAPLTRYDVQALTHAVRAGSAPDGRRLDPIMPRVALADDEVQALLAYLQQLSHPVAQRDASLRIALLLPRPGRQPIADALHDALRSCRPAETGRLAAFDVVSFDTPEEAAELLQSQLHPSRDTLLLAPFIAGWEQTYADLMHGRNIVTALPFSMLDAPQGARWDYAFPGVQAQLARLLDVAQARGHRSLAITYDPDDPLSAQLYRHVVALAPRTGLTLRPWHSDESARLWLRPAHADHDISAQPTSMLQLAPAMYAPDPTVVTAPSGAARWIVAYPYNPVAADGRWIGPAAAWASAACDLLAQLDPLRRLQPQLQTIRLMQGATVLTAESSDAAQIAHVHLLQR